MTGHGGSQFNYSVKRAKSLDLLSFEHSVDLHVIKSWVCSFLFTNGLILQLHKTTAWLSSLVSTNKV